MAVGPSSASSGSPSKGGCPSHPSLPRYLSCWHRGLRHASCLQGYRSREQLIGFLITRTSRGHVMLSKNPLLLTLCSDGSTRGPARSAVPNKPLAGEQRAVFHADAPDCFHSFLGASCGWAAGEGRCLSPPTALIRGKG